MINTMKRLYKIYLSLAIIFSAGIFFAGCDLTELDTLDNPNFLTTDAADADLFLNSIQIDVAAFFMSDNTDNFDGASELAAEPVRMLHMFGPTYTNAYEPNDYNEVWEDAYSDVLIDIRSMNLLAVPDSLYTHVAMGQIIEAYVLMTLVDLFGDVPYTEAFQGAANLNPVADPGADVYATADDLLVEAIENLGRTPFAEPEVDLYYGGDKASWINLANTLRIKLWTNLRLTRAADATDEINDIIASGNFINATNGGEWIFEYSTTDNNPDSRHPWFADNYDETQPSADYYMNVAYMNNMFVGVGGEEDPRLRYYFYRQVADLDDADFQTKPCVLELTPPHYEADDVFCEFGSGFWGRDHGDADGIPPDAQFRTTFGVYPVGGLYDDDSFDLVNSRNVATQGAGFAPLMMASYVHFYLAEGALLGGITGDARTYLEDAITQSINYVTAYGDARGASGATLPTNEAAYIAAVMAEYDAATDDDGRMQIIAEQFMIAAWGNGIEAYNLYRRTGFPNDLQPTILEAPGDFIRSFWYPGVSVDNNSSITQKSSQAAQVFWDNNPAGFID